MQRVRSWLSKPSFLVVLLSLGAVRPILTPAKTPLADDFAYHLHRLIALRHLVSEGVIFTRWFPDLALGYGYPLFNFAAPFPYYVALPFSWLFSAETAIQLTLALAVTLSGWAMWQLLHCYVRPMAALIGATAWLYAPYLLYDLHFRANLGEVVALACLPFTLWGITKLIHANQPRWLLLTAFSITAALLSHNIIGLLLLPLATVYAAILATQSNHRGLTVYWQLFSIILIGLGLATFFWLPAFIEKEIAAFPRLMSNPAYSVFNNFLTLREVFAFPPLIYANRINPSPPITLGIIPVLLAISGWLGRRKMTTQQRILFALSTVATFFMAFMVTGYSESVWQQIALLQFFQFPWRLLAFGALFVSIMIGFSAEILPKPLKLLTLLLIILNAQSWTLPAYAPKGEATLTDVIAYEQAVGTLGTTVAGEYLPGTVDLIPDRPADRLFVGQGIVEEGQARGFRPTFTATITSPNPQTLMLNQFAFVGWQTTVNGTPVPITPSNPNGLITFPVPAGANTVIVQFATTPLRLFASLVSFASFALLLFLAFRAKSAEDERSYSQPVPIWIAPVALLALIAPSLRPVQSAENTLADYGDVRLIAAELPQRCQQPCSIPVHLTYATDQTPAQILQSKLTLRDANGVLYSLPDSRVPARFRSAIPSNAWPPDHTAADVQQIAPIPGIPAGEYTIELTVFDRQTLQPLRVQATNLATLSLGTITIEPPAHSVVLSPPNTVESAQHRPELLGYAIDRTEVRPGDPVLVSLFWATKEDVAFSPELVFGDTLNAVGERSAQSTHTVEAGHSIQTRHLLRVPAEVMQARAAIVVALAGEQQTLIPLTVDVPTRSMTPPTVEKLVGQSAADHIMLYGVTVKESEGEISAEIIWHALSQLDVNYRVFVHLIDENDNIIAQSDADPANWTRPTTGWLPNEYISDVHRLPKPNQPYRLRIGLYDPITLTRPAEPILLE